MAEFWGQTVRTVQRWVKKGWPVHDKVDTAKRILRQQKVKPELKMRAEQVLDRAHRVESATYTEGETHDGEEVSHTGAAVSLPDPDVRMAGDSMEDLRDFYKAQLMAAVNKGQQGSISFYDDKLRRVQKDIRDDELHAQKMGLDKGEIVTRETVDRFAYALAFQLLQGINRSQKLLAPSLIGLGFVEEARNVLDDHLTHSLIVEPLAGACGVDYGGKLPEFFVEAVARAVQHFVENGASDFYAELQKLEATDA